MCSKMFVSSILLSLLPGCMESGYLVTSLAGDPAATGQPAQATALRYTNHRPAAIVEEIVPLRITGSFSLGDRAKILRAVNEWNVALNGFVRFAIVDDAAAPAADARQPRPWTIMAAQGVGPRVAPGPTTALAHTQPVPGAGGLMIVYLDRIGMRDLGGVVMHELGHVLGLGHGERGLMAAHYHPTDQQCVDKTTITAVAAKRQLAVDRLNWCETNVASAAR
ncbi:MAG: matrixin family metalloprotease [Rhodospirillales bacterium]|nr:matrixin family metalloprotease [Rhodospirillales bacterium]